MRYLSILLALLLGVSSTYPNAAKNSRTGDTINVVTGSDDADGSELGEGKWADSLVCITNGIAEDEPCGTDVNNGPFGAGAWGIIAESTTICGTLWADGGARDNDCFHYTIASPLGEVITWHAVADPINYYIMVMDSGAIGYYDYDVGTSGEPTTVQLYLGPGTYTTRVTPILTSGNGYEFACGANPKDPINGNWRYRLSIDKREVHTFDDCEAAVPIMASGTYTWDLTGMTPGNSLVGFTGRNAWFEFIPPSVGIVHVEAFINAPFDYHWGIAAGTECGGGAFTFDYTGYHTDEPMIIEFPSIPGTNTIIEVAAHAPDTFVCSGWLDISVLPLPALTDDTASVQPGTDSSYSTKLAAEAKTVYEALDEGRIAFKPRDTMRQGVKENVTVRVSLDSLAGFTEGFDGVPSVERVIVSPFMSARLVGDSDEFEIEELSTTDQPILDEYTEWFWTVTPLRSGEKKLFLTISARLPLSNGQVDRKDLPPKEVVIMVEGNLFWWLTKFWERNEGVVLGVLLTVAIGIIMTGLRWIWTIAHRKKRQPPGFER